MHSGSPHFFSVDAPALSSLAILRDRAGFHVRGVGAMLRLGQAKGHSARTVQSSGNELLLLLGRAKIAKDQDCWVIADDGMLVLQIVVQAQSPGCEMLADDGHPQVRTVL